MRNKKEICQPTINRITKAFKKRLNELQMSRRHFCKETGVTEYTCYLICQGKSMSLFTLIHALDAAGLELEVKLK